VTIKCPQCNFENPDDTLYCGKCAAPLKPSEKVSVSHTETLETPRQELTTGSTFAGRYQIIEELGKGGMGRVYKAFDKEIKGKVALKLIKPEVAADEKTIERFRNELKVTRDIAHKNVCRMYDLNKQEGTYYITMEYVSGEDLKSFVRRAGPLSAGKTVFIAKQVCEGLIEAHGRGVVHRDLKPQNIMIDKDGNARIMDFGIARSLKAKGITGAGVMIGTPEYMSPEQAEAKEVDKRSDIYSLGVILYEMVTGRIPFEGETPLSIAMKHKGEMPVDPREINSQIPEELSRLILRCMEKDRSGRFQSAEELFSELSKLEKGIPTTEKVVPRRKSTTSKEITVTFSPKKLLVPALIVVALVIATIAILKLLPQKEPASIPSGKPSLAVMYFKNDTGDTNLEHWRSAFSQWLITDLSQSKHINVLSMDRLFSILRKLDLLQARSYASEDLRRVAAEGGASHILTASLTRAGNIFRIDYSLQDANTLNPVASDYVTGSGEESFPSLVDEMTRKIKAGFKLSQDQIASDIDEKVGQITTASPEAYKYYSEGVEYYNQGDRRSAIQLFERAIEIDPEFAMAYRHLAFAYGFFGDRDKQDQYFQKAFQLADRVSEREKYRLQGDYYRLKERTYDKAIEAFDKLLSIYPDDGIGNRGMGHIYINLEEFDKALEYWKRNFDNRYEVVYTYINLASAYEFLGMYDKARNALEYYLENVSESDYIHRDLARNYANQGEYDLALIELDKAFSLNPANYQNILLRGDIHHLRGDLSEAEQEYMKLLENREDIARIRGRESLLNLYLSQGKLDDSIEQAQKGIELARKISNTQAESNFFVRLACVQLKSGNPQESLSACEKALDTAIEADSSRHHGFALFYRGFVSIKMNSLDDAQRVAEELKEFIEAGMNKKFMRFYYHLLGRIEMKKGNFKRAIEFFKQALSLIPFKDIGIRTPAYFIEPLARAYYESEDLEKAQTEYEKIAHLTLGRLEHGDIYAQSFSMLGRIFEQTGWKGKAIENYEKFLELWTDADPGFPEIEDAKMRLASLKN